MVYMYVHTNIHGHRHTHILMCVCVCVCVYRYTHLPTDTYTDTYTHTQTFKGVRLTCKVKQDKLPFLSVWCSLTGLSFTFLQPCLLCLCFFWRHGGDGFFVTGRGSSGGIWIASWSPSHVPKVRSGNKKSDKIYKWCYNEIPQDRIDEECCRQNITYESLLVSIWSSSKSTMIFLLNKCEKSLCTVRK